jgi:sRNA-binding carbon storage regulator CsrA
MHRFRPRVLDKTRVLDKIQVGRNKTVTILSVKDGKVRFGIDVPKRVKVCTERGEVGKSRRRKVVSWRQYH